MNFDQQKLDNLRNAGILSGEMSDSEGHWFGVGFHAGLDHARSYTLLDKNYWEMACNRDWLRSKGLMKRDSDEFKTHTTFQECILIGLSHSKKEVSELLEKIKIENARIRKPNFKTHNQLIEDAGCASFMIDRLISEFNEKIRGPE